MTAARSWTLRLPYTHPPLTMNGRLHRHAQARLVKQVRRAVGYLARSQKIPALARVAVELHYVPATARRRDPINLAPTAKACEDGLVDAGIVPDDTPQYVQPTPAVIHDPGPPPRDGDVSRLYLVVHELPAAPELAGHPTTARAERSRAGRVWSPW